MLSGSLKQQYPSELSRCTSKRSHLGWCSEEGFPRQVGRGVAASGATLSWPLTRYADRAHWPQLTSHKKVRRETRRQDQSCHSDFEWPVAIRLCPNPGARLWNPARGARSVQAHAGLCRKLGRERHTPNHTTCGFDYLGSVLNISLVRGSGFYSPPARGHGPQG